MIINNNQSPTFIELQIRMCYSSCTDGVVAKQNACNEIISNPGFRLEMQVELKII